MWRHISQIILLCFSNFCIWRQLNVWIKTQMLIYSGIGKASRKQLFLENASERTGHAMRADFPIYQKYISDKIFKLQGLSEENLSGLLVVYILTVTNAPLRLRKRNMSDITGLDFFPNRPCLSSLRSQSLRFKEVSVKNRDHLHHCIFSTIRECILLF